VTTVEARPPIARRILRASAIRIRLANRKLAKAEAARKQEWQAEAWDYFDAVPEVKSLMWFLGNAMSKLKLYVAVRPLDDPNAAPLPATDPEAGIPLALAQRAQLEIDRMKGQLGGRSEIIRELTMNLNIAGECYLVYRGPRSQTVGGELLLIDESWEVRSTREVTVKGDGEYYIKDDPNGPGDGVKLDENIDAIVRIYQRHPGASALADCHMRGVLSECELLVLLTNELKAESKSRQSAGILTLPNELSQGPMNTDDVEGEDGEEAEADPFEDALMNALVAPIEDPAAAEAVYPLIVRGEAEFLHPNFFRHFSLARDTTSQIEERIEKRVERLARGLNAPVEATMGHQATTFANAFQVNEDVFEDHLQPGAVLLVDALTVGVLRPNLLDAGAGDPALIERLIVWFDPADIFKHVDPQEKAKEAYDIGAISWEAYRSYNGFNDGDAPDPIEQLFRAILDLRRVDPNLVDAIIREYDPNIKPPPPVQDTSGGGGGTTASVDPRVQSLQLLAHLLRSPGSTEAITAAAGRVKRSRGALGVRLFEIDRELRTKLLAATDRAVTRALERAGTKLKVARKPVWGTTLKSVHSRYAASVLGPEVVRASGFQDEDLIGDDAWIALEEQFRAWGAQSQRQALDVVNDVIGISTADRTALQLRQAADLDQAWSWMSDQLHDLAIAKLYSPDAAAHVVGEFDPTLTVPTGLVRQAISRAGGTSLDVTGTSPFVAVTASGDAPGGIGLGGLVLDYLSTNDTLVEAYEWVYGPAARQHPFEEHEALDGVTFRNFDADVLAAGDWIGDYYFPGDHDGCACDFIPTFALPEDIEE